MIDMAGSSFWIATGSSAIGTAVSSGADLSAFVALSDPGVFPDPVAGVSRAASVLAKPLPVLRRAFTGLVAFFCASVAERAVAAEPLAAASALDDAAGTGGTSGAAGGIAGSDLAIPSCGVVPVGFTT